MATFFGFLIFAPLMALFFGFLLWFVPAMILPDQVSRRRPRLYGYLVTGYGLLAFLSLFLLLSSSHDVAPILGTAVSFGIVAFVRARRRGGKPNAWANAPWRRRWASKFGFDPNEPTNPGFGGFDDLDDPDPGDHRAAGGDAAGSDPRSDPRSDPLSDPRGDGSGGGRRYPRAQPPPQHRAGDPDGLPDTDPF